MTLAHEIEALRDYPARASEEFREQIDRARELRERAAGTGSSGSQQRGIDRSKELNPIQRPAILRTVAINEP